MLFNKITLYLWVYIGIFLKKKRTILCKYSVYCGMPGFPAPKRGISAVSAYPVHDVTICLGGTNNEKKIGIMQIAVWGCTISGSIPDLVICSMMGAVRLASWVRMVF